MLRTGVFLFFALVAFAPQAALSADRAKGSKQAEVRRSKRAQSFFPVDMKNFSVRGRPYTLVERKNPDGQVIEQYLITKDRTEISRDPKGLGFLKSWELVTPGRRIHLHEPRGGHFSLMDVEQVTKKFIYNMSFVRTDAGKYRLLNVKTRKFGSQLSWMPVEVIAGCHSTDPALQKLSGEMNEIVKAAAPDDFDKVIDKQILDESCKNKPFDDRTKEILDGIRTVFKSDNEWSVARSEEAKKKQFDKTVTSQGAYLQCLRYHELDTHASRIEAALAGFIGAQDDKHKKFPWKIRCETATYYKRTKTYGEFTPSIGLQGEENSPAPIITFVDNYGPAGSFGGLPKRGKDDDSYAKTFFHEMLHYSLIGDGPLLNTIVDCCVPGPGSDKTDPNSKACKSLDVMVRKLELTQQVTNQFAKIFGGQPQLTELMQEVKNTYGTHEGERMMYKVFEDIGGAYSDLEQEKKCNFSSQDKISDSCLKELHARIDKVLDEDLKDQPALREAIRAKLGLAAIKNAAGNSYCVAKPKSAREFLRQDFEQQLRQVAGWLLPAAWAAGSSGDEYFCSIANEKPQGKVDYSLPLSDYEQAAVFKVNRSQTTVPQMGEQAGLQSLIAPGGELNERAGKGGSSSSSYSSSPRSGSSEAKRYDQPVASGPRRTHYSDNSSERAIQIEKLYRNEESGVTGYFNRLAAKLESVTIPEAKASEPVAKRAAGREEMETSAASAAKDSVMASVSRESSGRGTRVPASENYNVRVPSFDVPDPFVGGGGLGTTPGLDAGPTMASSGKSNPGGLKASTENQRQMAQALGASSAAGGGVVGGGARGGAGSSSLLASGGPGTDGPSSSSSSSKPVPGKIGGRKNSDRQPSSSETDRAAQALLMHLQKSYSLIKHELKRPSVVKAMQRHFIQVIDDEGRVYGSGFPKTGRKLIYNREKDRLVPEAGIGP